MDSLTYIIFSGKMSGLVPISKFGYTKKLIYALVSYGVEIDMLCIKKHFLNILS